MMQKTPQVTFGGQVRRGFDNWKKGRVEFTIEAESGSWTVKLYHDVNPNRVVHRYKSLLGKSASIVFKCSRLIIGDKTDGELHIKIPEHESTNAQRLVKKITSCSVSTPTPNRAEVGLTSSRNGYPNSDGKVSKVSTLPMSEGWLSKKTPPPSYQQKHQASSAKRKIQLDPADKQLCNGNGLSNGGEKSRLQDEDFYMLDEDEDEEVTFPHFTGMKDYSKSCKDTVANFGKGLGPASFYGADQSLMTENTYRGLNRKPTSSNTSSLHNGLRSPKVKRPKLSDIDNADRENKVEVSAASKALLKGALSHRMTGKTPTLSDPQEGGACGGTENDEVASSLDASGHNSDGHMVGFDNLGNTCFMNSPLQCLSALEPLSLDIQSAICTYGSQLPPNSITRMLYLLMKDVRKLDIRPERVREILTRLRHDINGKFEYNTQQDAHELLAELLDRTDEEVKALLTNTPQKSGNALVSPHSSSTSTNGKQENAGNQEAPKPLSPSGDRMKSTPTEANFTWFYKTSFFFHECKTEVLSSQDERDTTLMLALDSKTSMNLQDCIDKYFESSEVDMRCEKCGKEEKATMTRKIVKRPRCFILNLLRYHTHNLEAKKKLDRVSIPRYMSVVEFCAEDVKAAPAIEPVFMLERLPYEASLPSESANGSQVCTPAMEAAKRGHAVALSMANEEKRKKVELAVLRGPFSPGQRERKAVETSDNLDTIREDVGENRADGEEQSDPGERQRLMVRRLSRLLVDQFSEVEQHIEMARAAQEDFTDIYTEAQNLIVTMHDSVQDFVKKSYELADGETSESEAFKAAEQNVLCEVLIERALVGNEELEDDFDYDLVRKRLLAVRYRSVHGETAQMNHLINDLAMYLAAKEVGMVVEPDQPRPRKDSPSPHGSRSAGPSKGNSGSAQDHSYECETEVTAKGCGGDEDTDECTSHGEVFMEEDSGNRGSIEVNPSGVSSRNSSAGEETESCSSTKAIQASRDSNSREGRGSGRHRQLDSRRVEITTEEESSGALGDVSNNATINTTNGLSSSICDPGFLGDGIDKSLLDDPVFLGRPVSDWSEMELQDVEIGALSEEDMMVYAQALSRLEYEREQISHTVSTSVAPTAVVRPASSDIVDSEDLTTVSYDDSSVSSVPDKSGVDSAGKVVAGLPEGKNSGDVSSTSGSSLSETSDVERAACELGSIVSKRVSGVKSDSGEKGGRAASKLPLELECDEELLSDGDEPDGMKDDSLVKVKGLKGGQAGSASGLSPSGSSTESRSKLSDKEKTCKSGGQAESKNKLCSPGKSSPALQSIDSGKVLSPHKSLSNHSNTLVQSNKSSSRDPSTERNGRSASHGNLSPRGLSISPAVSSLSSSSSGSGGGKHPKFGSRDMSMVSPSVSQSSPRRDSYSVSHSKSARNELARLRSPSSTSPRKRSHKDSSGSASPHSSRSRPGSASKRLLFEDENGNNNNKTQGDVKRSLEPVSPGLTVNKISSANSLLENYPMQEDLIGLSLAKSEEGELADPDGIHKLLGSTSSKPDRSSSSSSSIFSPSSKAKSRTDNDQAISIVSSLSNIPHPVPVGGPMQISANGVKTECLLQSPSQKPQLAQILSPSTFREEENQKPGAVSLKSAASSEVNMLKAEEFGDAENADPVNASARPKTHRQQLSTSDEKENVVESGARRERLDNIEMGKADCSYRLVGIVNHHGESLFAGHYTAFSFNFNKQRWFYMDDKHTRATTETTARAESANSGYVFFYMDKDIFDQYAQTVAERPGKKPSTNC